MPPRATQSALPRQRYSLLGFAQPGPKTLKWTAIVAAATAAGITIGIVLLKYGWHVNATQATYDNGEPGQGALAWAWIFILTRCGSASAPSSAPSRSSRLSGAASTRRGRPA